jgi:hypothetical protein
MAMFLDLRIRYIQKEKGISYRQATGELFGAMYEDLRSIPRRLIKRYKPEPTSNCP